MSEPIDRGRLAVLVHEVRSPVAALAAIAGALEETGDQVPERGELVRLAITACRGLERIVVDAVTASVRSELVDAGALVRDAVTAAALGGARVEAQVEPDLPLVRGDAVRLRQALDNLVSNALVHSGSSAAVEVGACVSAGDVLIFVSDAGVGIPESEQGRIFEAGVRLDSGRPGSGLGLAVVRAIAEAHGRRLTVTSSPGNGATFTIALPID